MNILQERICFVFMMKSSLSYRIDRLNQIGLFAIRYNDYYKYDTLF